MKNLVVLSGAGMSAESGVNFSEHCVKGITPVNENIKRHLDMYTNGISRQ